MTNYLFIQKIFKDYEAVNPIMFYMDETLSFKHYNKKIEHP